MDFAVQFQLLFTPLGLLIIDASILTPSSTFALLQGNGRHLPIGLQIVGREFDEAGIIQLAHAFEQTLLLDPAAKMAVL